LAYETPVWGYPWSIPMEFPIYQWIVALFGLIGIPIETAGRLFFHRMSVANVDHISVHENKNGNFSHYRDFAPFVSAISVF
jgi:hypothetical protein